MLKALQLFTNLDYYVELANGSWKKVWLSFLGLTSLISLVSGAVMSYLIYPELIQAPSFISQQIKTDLPANLQISWNQEQLWLQPVPETGLKINWPPNLQAESLPPVLANYLPRDITSSELETATIPKSMFLFTPSQFRILSFETNRWSEPLSLKNLPSLNTLPTQSFARPEIEGIINQLHDQLVRLIKVGLIFYPVFNVVINWWNSLWFCLFEAIFIWLLGRIIQWQLEWQKLFKLNLLIMPAALSLGVLANWLYTDLNWSFFHLTYWLIFVLINIRQPKLISRN